ncbi:hypothetical protein GCM10010468_29970 [Actinocorallia longicatena]|uniref:LytR cell envelope-related transcriptional attenuator n=2 Tax=Actinocorallia longicatena TaxID=111803 RepID=A0ABP6Q8Q4_9ACTN
MELLGLAIPPPVQLMPVPAAPPLPEASPETSPDTGTGSGTGSGHRPLRRGRRALLAVVTAGVLGTGLLLGLNAGPGESKAMVPSLDKARIPSVTPSATVQSLAGHGWDYRHRVLGGDDAQARGVSRYMARELKIKSALVPVQAERAA